MSLTTGGDFIKEIRKRPQNFYLIHYSCQNLNDDNEGLSPRITSIAVAHYATGQTVSFSTHAIAEELRIPREKVHEKFDEIELELLSKFYDFARDRRDKFWLHWNMRNLTYGFEHLEHRFRTLAEREAPSIPVERRINVSDIIADRYGNDFAEHPKMQSLMNLNGGIHRHFLIGEEEVEAFKNSEFIKMHNSTLAKVGFFQNLLKKMLQGKLRTASNTLGVRLDRIFESRFAKLIGLTSTLITLLVFSNSVLQHLISP